MAKNLMSEVLQEAVNEAKSQIVDENKLRIAMEPKLDFPGGQEEVERRWKQRAISPSS